MTEHEMREAMARPAAESLGPHLLGRKPHPGDPRDWRLEDLIVPDPDPAVIDETLRDIIENGTYATWRGWVRLYDVIVKPNRGPAPAPAPAPPSPPAPLPGIGWPGLQLDQGQTGHCVGFGGENWKQAPPIVDPGASNAAGHALYYACKVKDGEPGAEDGSTVHTLAKVLKDQGRIDAYAWLRDISEVPKAAALGPLVHGTDWRDGMFNPDADGYVRPTGKVAGGHCYVTPQNGTGPCIDGSCPFDISFDNSWGKTWGDHGRFYMHSKDWAPLGFGSGAEVMAAAERPL